MRAKSGPIVARNERTPRSREGKLPIRRNDYVLDSVGMTPEGFFGLSVTCALISGEIPHQDGLVCGKKRVSVVTIQDLEGKRVPLEADKIMSLFSAVVAMLLTQPLCP